MVREATLHSDGAKSDKIPISFQVCPRGLSLPGGSHFWHTHPEFTFIQSVSGILLGGQHAATTRFLSPCTCFAAASFDVRPLPRRFVAVFGFTLFGRSILSEAAVRDTSGATAAVTVASCRLPSQSCAACVCVWARPPMLGGSVKKERKQTTQGRDGRTARRHHTGILRRGV